MNERKLEIARNRGVTSDILLDHDLTDSKILYDGDHLTKHKKADLITELEKYLDSEDYCYVAHSSPAFKCSFVIDVMANIRKIPSKCLFTCGELVSQFLTNFRGAIKQGRVKLMRPQ